MRTEQAIQRVYDDDLHYEEMVGGCKTPTSIRTNYMPEVLMEKLLVWQDYLAGQPNGQALTAPSAPVFPSTRTWERRTYSGFRSSYRNFLKRNGLPLEHMNLHRFRHAVATVMLEEGINPRVVQEELGHADIKTTLGTYSHVIPSLRCLEALRKTGKILSAYLVHIPEAKSHVHGEIEPGRRRN